MGTPTRSRNREFTEIDRAARASEVEAVHQAGLWRLDQRQARTLAVQG